MAPDLSLRVIGRPNRQNYDATLHSTNKKLPDADSGRDNYV